MDPVAATHRLKERGFTSIQFALAAGLSLVLFVLLANLVVVQYGRGALRSATEQGARVGSVAGVAACQAAANQVVADLLGGRMSDDVELSCVVAGTDVVATAEGRFMSWLPLMPDFEIRLSGSARVEPSP